MLFFDTFQDDQSQNTTSFSAVLLKINFVVPISGFWYAICVNDNVAISYVFATSQNCYNLINIK